MERAFQALRALELKVALNWTVDADPMLQAKLLHQLAIIKDLREQIRAHGARIGTAFECPADMNAVQMLSHDAKQHMMFFAMTREEQLAVLHTLRRSTEAMPPDSAVA